MRTKTGLTPCFTRNGFHAGFHALVSRIMSAVERYTAARMAGVVAAEKEIARQI